MSYMPISTMYTSYGEFFFKQGRSKYFKVKGCVTLCIAKYKHNGSEAMFYDEIIKKSARYPFLNRRSIHSEEFVLKAVQESEKYTNSKCIRLELYSSYSPCLNCCRLIHNFILHHPHCEVYIAFTCVYQPEDRENISSLQALNALNNVKLFDIFTINEWCLLQERGMLVMSQFGMNLMGLWDRYWRIVLWRLISTPLQ